MVVMHEKHLAVVRRVGGLRVRPGGVGLRRAVQSLPRGQIIERRARRGGESVKERLEYKVNIELQGKSIDTILAEVCRLANLKYYIQNRQVTITVNSSPKPTTKVKKQSIFQGR